MSNKSGKVMLDIGGSFYMVDAGDAVQVMQALAGSDTYEGDYADASCQWKPSDNAYRSRVTATVLSPADVAKLALKQD